MHYRLFLCGVLLLYCFSARAEASTAEVTIQRTEIGAQTVYAVEAIGTVQASPEVVWKTLTDYEKLPDFVPDMVASKILSREGNTVLVEQTGVARFLFFSHSIHLVVRVTEQAQTGIDTTQVSGDMAYFTSRWEISALPGQSGTRIVYRGKMAPDFYVPSLLSVVIIRAEVKRMMTAVFAHIEWAQTTW